MFGRKDNYSISAEEVYKLKQHITLQSKEIEELKQRLSCGNYNKLELELAESNRLKQLYIDNIEQQNKEITSLKATIVNERSTLTLLLETLKITNDTCEHTLLKSKLATKIGSLRASDFY
jgi:septal ring factor EnvC (AmiA/AmiB activator)